MRTFPFPNHKLFPETGKQEEGNKRKENLHMASSEEKKKILCNEVIGQKVNCPQALLPEEFGLSLDRESSE